MRTGIGTEAFYGDCLAALGIPDRGTAVIDYDAEPRVFDIVLCDSTIGSITLYLKELVQTGDHPVFRTRYADGRQNYAFTGKIMGVVFEIKDENGNTVWKRKEKTHRDELRAMTDEELAAWIADQPVVSTFDPKNERHVAWLNWLRTEIEP